MIHRDNHGPIALLRMEHGKANALDTELLDELTESLDAVRASDAAGLVLTGTGPIFSAGVDLFRVLDGGRDYLEAFLPAISRALRGLFAFPRPVVAALNGHAIAGGCILACACDLRLLARGGDKPGRIGVPELRVGVPFPAVALEILRFAVPRQHLQELAYVGRTFDADDALARGLVDELVEPERLQERALEVARTLVDVPRGTFELSKRQLRQPTLDRLADLEREIDPEVYDLWARPEIHEHIREYLARTLSKK